MVLTLSAQLIFFFREKYLRILNESWKSLNKSLIITIIIILFFPKKKPPLADDVNNFCLKISCSNWWVHYFQLIIALYIKRYNRESSGRSYYIILVLLIIHWTLLVIGVLMNISHYWFFVHTRGSLWFLIKHNILFNRLEFSKPMLWFDVIAQQQANAVEDFFVLCFVLYGHENWRCHFGQTLYVPLFQVLHWMSAWK